jgi:hypothetical protein
VSKTAELYRHLSIPPLRIGGGKQKCKMDRRIRSLLRRPEWEEDIFHLECSTHPVEEGRGLVTIDHLKQIYQFCGDKFTNFAVCLQTEQNIFVSEINKG